MKLVVQRVSSAQVSVNNQIVGKINQGLLIFLGIHKTDQISCIDPLIEKVLNLRIFSDPQDKMNLSLRDVQGELLIVSQFTLYADTSKGKRPSFTDSAPYKDAKAIYEAFIEEAKKRIFPQNVQTGLFGANMQVQLVNDGPVTFVLEDNV